MSVPSPFTLVTLAMWFAIVGSAVLHRRGPIVYVVAVLGVVHSSISLSVAPLLGWPAPLLIALQLFTFAPFLRLRASELRPTWFHILVTMPGSWWFAGVLLSFPWAISVAVGHPLRWPFIPFVLASFGVVESLRRKEEIVDVVLDGIARADAPHRHRSPPVPAEASPLRILQITDPHLGPFMSERRLHGICERAVARDPELVMLTGDFLTIESNRDPQALKRALAPLVALRGRTFACFGNHDHEAPEIVRAALEAAGVKLLVDDSTLVTTSLGPVQIVGADYRRNGREEHLRALVAAHPRADGALRIVLLHDPGAFVHLPEGEGDLVLSGHTHGGQLGLLRIGLPHTVVSALTKIPDHGLWARGKDRLYVHRGTGHYGFPLRIGVPTEDSVLRVFVSR